MLVFKKKLRRFQGFYIQKRSLRDYQVNYGANVFGFITQVNEAIINKNPYVILDGGHNIDGIRSFTNTLKEYFKDKVTFFFGILKDKSPEEALQLILPLAKEIYTLTPLSPRALKAADLAGLIKKYSDIKVIPLENYEDMLPIIKNAGKNEIIAFSGSLYMIGNVRTLLRNNGITNNL